MVKVNDWTGFIQTLDRKKYIKKIVSWHNIVDTRETIDGGFEMSLTVKRPLGTVCLPNVPFALLVNPLIYFPLVNVLNQWSHI